MFGHLILSYVTVCTLATDVRYRYIWFCNEDSTLPGVVLLQASVPTVTLPYARFLLWPFVPVRFKM